MAKNYTLDRSRANGQWAWQCTDGSTGGTASSKSGARAEAKKACGDSVRITPPIVDGEFRDGRLIEFAAFNLDEERVRYKTTQINEDAFLFFYGVDCLQLEPLTDVEKATTILTIWGIFRGGTTEPILKGDTI